MDRFFELSKRSSKNGRRKIKMSLLEIHQDNESTNKNGIHWKEEYILNNLESAKGMPIAAEFLTDDKDIPFGHGLTGVDSTENEPIFENSECVGCIETAYPANVEINGVKKRVLLGEGYIFSQRYPKFTKWLNNEINSGNVLSSIEIMGTEDNDNLIMYENNDYSPEFRTPQEFSFSGTAILSVEAADDSALILQINSKEEDENMDEKMLSAFVDSVKATIVEINDKTSAYEDEKTCLTSELNEVKANYETVKAALDAAKKELEELHTEIDAKYAEIDALKAALGKAEAENKIREMEDAIAKFSETEKEYAQTEINSFKENPENGSIDGIVAKIYASIGEKAKADAEKHIAEQNAAQNDVVDIFANVEPTGSNDDANIF